MPTKLTVHNKQTRLLIPLGWRRMYVGEAITEDCMFDEWGTGSRWVNYLNYEHEVPQTLDSFVFAHITSRPDPFLPRRKSCV